MENVLASINHYTGFVTQTFRPTQFTVLVFLCVFQKLFVNQNTVLIQTGYTGVFTADTFARMTTIQNLVTTLLHQSFAFIFIAYIHKSRPLRLVSLLHNALAKSTLYGLLEVFMLFTGPANVVRNCLAAAAKLFCATWTASNTVLAHVNSCFFGNHFTCFIFKVYWNISLLNRNFSSTRACHNSELLFEFFCLFDVYQFPVLFVGVAVDFAVIFYLFFTNIALNRLHFA